MKTIMPSLVTVAEAGPFRAAPEIAVDVCLRPAIDCLSGVVGGALIDAGGKACAELVHDLGTMVLHRVVKPVLKVATGLASHACKGTAKGE